MIRSLFNEDLVQLNESVNNWEDAIKVSCKKLIEFGYIKETYIDSIIRVIEEMGPYFIILDNFALPHANDFNSVFKSGISFTTFKKPIEFSNGKRVQVICTLATNDSEKHLDILRDLAIVLQKEDIVNEIIKVKNKKELKKILEEK